MTWLCGERVFGMDLDLGRRDDTLHAKSMQGAVNPRSNARSQPRREPFSRTRLHPPPSGGWVRETLVLQTDFHPRSRIEVIAQCIADKIEREHGEHDRERRE